MILVDPEDQWLLDIYAWQDNGSGYLSTRLHVGYKEGKRIRITTYLHHCIMGQPIWEGWEIDHENRDKSDYRRSNLRYATKSQNRVNRDLPYDNERGIQFRVDRNKYVVRIKRDNKMNYLGSFDTLAEAIATRDAWLCQ